MKAQGSAQSRVVMTEVVYPSHTNAIDTVFGGVVMSWVDIAGSISAIRYCGKTVVTASVDDVHFIAPAYKGDIINIRASVNFVHRTSMEVGVRVDSENPLSGQFCHIVSAYLTFVALNENKKPTLIQPLEPQTEDEKKRFKEAEIRRKWRLERRKLFYKHQEK